MPEEFWSLTVREFNLKFDAFERQEDRARSYVFEIAQLEEKDGKRRDRLAKAVNQLRRYPLKRWLLPESR